MYYNLVIETRVKVTWRLVEEWDLGIGDKTCPTFSLDHPLRPFLIGALHNSISLCLHAEPTEEMIDSPQVLLGEMGCH